MEHGNVATSVHVVLYVVSVGRRRMAAATSSSGRNEKQKIRIDQEKKEAAVCLSISFRLFLARRGIIIIYLPAAAAAPTTTFPGNVNRRPSPDNLQSVGHRAAIKFTALPTVVVDSFIRE